MNNSKERQKMWQYQKGKGITAVRLTVKRITKLATLMIFVMVAMCVFLVNVRAQSGINVLLIWDVNNTDTQVFKTALENAGMNVTLSDTSEMFYDGTNPSPTGFNVVIHLNGVTWNAEMPEAGQSALVDFVQNGGGYIGAEWSTYQISQGQMTTMRNLILFDRVIGGSSNGSIYYTEVSDMSDHPILTNVPASFTFTGGSNLGPSHSFTSNPVTVLMRSTTSNSSQGVSDAVATRQFGLGRVVGFNHAGNWDGADALSNPNIQQLYINGAIWAAGDINNNIVLDILDPAGSPVTQVITNADGWPTPNPLTVGAGNADVSGGRWGLRLPILFYHWLGR